MSGPSSGGGVSGEELIEEAKKEIEKLQKAEDVEE